MGHRTFSFRQTLILVAGLVLLLLWGRAVSQPLTTSVLGFSPQGEVRSVQQVTLRFSQDMVALGQSDAPNPVLLECTPGAEVSQRWLDTRRWVAEFRRTLPVGTRCKAQLQPGLRSLSGALVTASGPWTFSTGGPKVINQHPYPGQPLIEQQVFLLTTDAAVSRASLPGALQCVINDAQRSPVAILDPAATRARWQAIHGDDRFEADRTVALRCVQPLPAGAELRLVWGAAVATPSGVDSGSDQVLSGYRVRPPFSAKFECAQIDGTPGCDPRQGIRVEFTERVAVAELRQVTLTDGKGQALALKIDGPKEATTARSLLASPGRAGELLPEGSILSLQVPKTLRDADGRALTNAVDFPRAVAIATLPPYLGFPDTGGVLPYSAAVGARLPMAVRRLESSVQVQSMRIGGETLDPALGGDALQRRAKASAEALALWHSVEAWPQRSARPALPHAVMQQQRRLWAPVHTVQVDGANVEALNFVPVPLSRPGLYLLDAHSPRHASHLAAALAARDAAREPGSPASSQSNPEPRAALVQVSNLNLSVRLSAMGQSLLWVTAIDTGQAVADVEVDWLSCSGKLLAQGSTDAQGLMRISAELSFQAESERCPHPTGRGHSGLAVVARKGADLALLTDIHASYRYGYGSTAPSVGHTVLDRSLFKAGETVHMQHLQRLLTIDGFAPPPVGEGRMEIRFQTGAVLASLPLRWSAQGAANSEWRIPSDAKLGRYHVTVSAADGRSHQAAFQVEEFRTPVFEARLAGQAHWVKGQQHLPVAMRLSFLAGGAAAGEAVTLQGRYLPGVPAPVAGFNFSDIALPDWKAPSFAPQTTQLDARGQRQLDIVTAPLDRPATLQAEMRFSDPNGEVQTVAQAFPLWHAPTRLGVRANLRANADGPPRTVVLRAVVLDATNRPLVHQQLSLTAQGARFVRRNGVATIEWIGQPQNVCKSASDERGQIECEWTGLPERIDSAWIFTATAQESQGLPVRSSVALYEAQLRWAPSAEVLSLAPDQSQPLPAGAAARVSVRAPFWPANLLLTVEREGVLQTSLHHIVQERSRIELPLQPRFAPNVLVHGRFVRGLAEVPATVEGQMPGTLTSEHQLSLKLAPDRYALDVSLHSATSSLRPGGTAQVQVSVRQHQGGGPAANARVTLVAVDEALLALRDNPSWDLIGAMLRERVIGVRGGSMDRLIRRQTPMGPLPAYWPPDDHARRLEVSGSARKMMAMAPAPMPAAMAAPAAVRDAAATQSGPADAVRQDFNSLALWRTDVELDAKGQATVPVPFNDSLTRWRIVAIATAGADGFGSGQTTLQVSQPLQLFSGLPPVLRSGDRLTQQVTVRNAGPTVLTLKFNAAATPLQTANAPVSAACDTVGQSPCAPNQDAVARGLSVQRSLSLAPGQSLDMAWPVAVPEGVKRLDWHITVTTSDGRERDALQVSQRIIEALPETVRQATLLQVGADTRLPVSLPAEAQPGSAGVRINLTDSLVGSALHQVRAWMAEYPHACLEQKASKLVVSGDTQAWAQLMGELPKYLDAQGMARYFNEPGLQGSEVLTAYLLDVSAAQGWEIPQDSRQKMLEALERALDRTLDGKAAPLDWQPQRIGASATARQLALQATLAVYGRIAKPDALRLRADDLNPLPTLALVDWVRTLLALPPTSAETAALQRATLQLRSRYDAQGTQLNWRGDERDRWWWWMWSQDVAMARTTLLIQALLKRDAAWKDELPLLASGLVARQSQGRWSTTVGNAWGSIALKAFASSAEPGPVDGQTRLSLSGPSAQTATLNWPRPAPASLRGTPGTASELRLQHVGSGAPWANVSVTAAMRLTRPLQAGLQVEKSIAPVEQQHSGQWSVGDVVRVTLKLQSQAELTWVAVSDPIPSGATILGRGLGRESRMAQQGQTSAGRAWPAYIERAADGYRAYYGFVPQGNWSVEYTLRLNNAGRFELPPTRVEAMYAPEVHGEAPNLPWSVVDRRSNPAR